MDDRTRHRIRKHKNSYHSNYVNQTLRLNKNPQGSDATQAKWRSACLEHLIDKNWQPISYASRSLNTNEQKYSINEPELLAVVWSLEHYKY